MTFVILCPKCGARLESDANASGTEVNGPTCGQLLKIPHATLGPGATVGGFRIESLIGKGGMGVVFLAQQLSLDRDIAPKILPAQYVRQQDDVDRFVREMRVLAQLEHAHIVTAYDAGEDAGVLYLAMAFVKGESLAARLRREAPMPANEALRMIRKLAEAPDKRHSTWEALIDDIGRVMKNLSPHLGALPTNESALTHDGAATATGHTGRIMTGGAGAPAAAHHPIPSVAPRRAGPPAGVWVSLVVIGIGAAVWLVRPGPPVTHPVQQLAPVPVKTHATRMPPADPLLAALSNRFVEARRLAAAAPDDWQGATERYAALARHAAGTMWETRAREALLKLADTRNCSNWPAIRHPHPMAPTVWWRPSAG
jgi:hypothetical protein